MEQNEVVIVVEEPSDQHRKRPNPHPSKPRRCQCGFEFAAGLEEPLLCIPQKFWLIVLSGFLSILAVVMWMNTGAGREAFVSIGIFSFGSTLVIRNNFAVRNTMFIHWCQTIMLSCLFVYYIVILVITINAYQQIPESTEREGILMADEPIDKWRSECQTVIFCCPIMCSLTGVMLFICSRLLRYVHTH